MAFQPTTRVWMMIALSIATGLSGIFCVGNPLRTATSDGDAIKEASATDAHVAGSVAEPGVDRESIFNRRPERRIVEFKVHRISAPRGTFTASETIWQIVAGRLHSAATTLHLADNGFRAAIGLASHRQALVAELQSIPDYKMADDQVTPDVNRTIDLEMGTCADHEVVFYFDPAGGLHGMDFVQAKARLKLTLEWRSVNPDELWLRLTPELEEPAGPMKWEMTPDGPQLAPQRRVRAFDELSFEAAIPPGGFLLLGATGAVYDRPLLARPFLIETKGGENGRATEYREGLYVISPTIRVVATGSNGVSAGRLAGETSR